MMRKRHWTIRSIITLAALAALPGGSARGDAITLRAAVRVDHAKLVLADVAELDGPVAQRFASLEVGRVGAAGATVKMTEIRRRLDEDQVNWGMLILRGPRQVTVRGPAVRTKPPAPSRSAAGSDPQVTIVDPHTQVSANPIEPVTGPAVEVAPASSLKAMLGAWIGQQLGVDAAAVRIEPLDGQAEGWHWNNLGCRFEFESLSGERLGRVLFSVRRYRADRLDGQQRLGARVSVHRSVVVAARPLQRGQSIASEDVRIEPRWLDSEAARPITTLRDAVGRTAVHAIKPGVLLDQTDIQPQRLVRRGQLLTVRCLHGALVIKTVGRAMEDGVAGQVIEVRNERTRRTYRATVTGPMEAILTADDAPAESATTQGGRS